MELKRELRWKEQLFISLSFTVHVTLKYYCELSKCPPSYKDQSPPSLWTKLKGIHSKDPWVSAIHQNTSKDWKMLIKISSFSPQITLGLRWGGRFWRGWGHWHYIRGDHTTIGGGYCLDTWTIVSNYINFSLLLSVLQRSVLEYWVQKLQCCVQIALYCVQIALYRVQIALYCVQEISGIVPICT